MTSDTLTSRSRPSTPSEIDRIEDYPGYSQSTGALVVPGEVLTDERCGECGSRLLAMPVGFTWAVDCPWCMTHREPEGRDEGLSHRMEEAAIPARYRKLEPTWGHLTDLKAGKGLWLEGRGDGRTAYAVRVLKAWIRDGGTGRFVGEYELFSAAPDAVERMYRTGLLVIDSLGLSSDPGAWGLRKLGAVIDMRHREGLPTVVTSEYAPSEAAKRLGGVDAGVEKVVEMAMETMRRVAA